MIEGLIGRPGSGKSYTLTAKILDAADSGRHVYANYGVRHQNVWQFGPSDLLHLPPGLVVIDEAHLWFPARGSLKLPPSWLAGMSQTRKKGWDLLWATQHESRVDRVVRDVTSWMWLCRSYKGLLGGSGAKWFSAICWEPEDFRTPKKSMGKQLRRFSQRVADAYDTYESLTVAEHAQSDSDAYDPGARTRTGRSTRTSRRTRSPLEDVFDEYEESA